MHRIQQTRRDGLAIAATAFLAANLLHGADHIRQHLAGVDIEVFLGGGMLTVGAVVVFLAARRRHLLAPTLAAYMGFLAAVLVAASHIAPHWSVLSDSYIDDIHPDALSWVVMLLEIAAGLALGVVGIRRLRARARAADHTRHVAGAHQARAARAPNKTAEA